MHSKMLYWMAGCSVWEYGLITNKEDGKLIPASPNNPVKQGSSNPVNKGSRKRNLVSTAATSTAKKIKSNNKKYLTKEKIHM